MCPREYLPETGRFVSEDLLKGRLTAPLTLNSYTYCCNQPIDFIDRRGTDREGAVEYAHEYATDVTNERNSDYPSFDVNCANFVSQSLVEGGGLSPSRDWNVADASDLYLGPGNILQYPARVSLAIFNAIHGTDVSLNVDDPNYPALVTPTWNNAQAHFEYFSNPDNGYINGPAITNVNSSYRNSSIQPGDLLYMDLDGDGVIDHAVMVTRVGPNGEIQYSGNTIERTDWELEDVFRQFPDADIKIVKLKDSVFSDTTWDDIECDHTPK